MTIPTDRKYLPTHEWHLISGDVATIGITKGAADELTDITFVALPKVGAAVSANQSFGEIESVKATSDLYSGVSGKVSEINAELINNPGLVNQDPFGKGWMIKVKLGNPADVEALLSAEEYGKQGGT